MFEHAVILAAGRGERMKPLTDYIPKALCKSDGLTLLHKAIHSLPDVPLSITYSYLGNQILNEFWNYKRNISFIHTDGQDNAWFIYNSPLKYINKPIVVIPCDISFEINWDELYYEFVQRKSEYMIIPVETNNEGDSLVTKEGKVVSIERKTGDYKASGIQIFIPSLVPGYNNFYNIWNYFIRQRKLDASCIRVKNWKAKDYV